MPPPEHSCVATTGARIDNLRGQAEKPAADVIIMATENSLGHPQHRIDKAIGSVKDFVLRVPGAQDHL